MGRLNSFQGSIAAFILKCFAVLVRVMPLPVALFLGRRIGDVAAAVNPRQRRMVMGHLKVAFGRTRPYAELKAILRKFYHAYGQSIIELARLPLIARDGYASIVDVEGREYVDAAMKKGRGCIFLAIHSGNWELSNIVGSMLGYPYSMVANDLNHINKVAEFLNDLRRSAGCRIINPGIGGREIIRRLQHNEIVTLVADQGGADGVPVPFFGRDASMSTGAVRIALKYDVPVVLVNIRRIGRGRHRVEARPFILSTTGDVERDIKDNLHAMMRQYQAWIEEHPYEYVWFYRTWKYAKDRLVVILDDGRVGHLRQSQAVVRAYTAAARQRGWTVSVETVAVRFKNGLAARLLPFFSGGRFLLEGANMEFLTRFLRPDCLAAFLRLRPDLVVSCGARNAAVNWWVAREDRACSVAVLPNRIIPSGAFDLIVRHQHDVRMERPAVNMLVTKVAPNLMDREYLQQSVGQLVSRYPRLGDGGRRKIALFIGGDARGVVMREDRIREVVRQVLAAAGDLGMEVLATTSRRTPASVKSMLVREFKGHPAVALLVVPEQQDIPEAVGGILGLADVAVVSGESVSMVSEALSSGKKTIVFSVGDGKEHKYARFCDMLSRQGHILYVVPERLARAVDLVVSGENVIIPVQDRDALAAALGRIIR